MFNGNDVRGELQQHLPVGALAIPSAMEPGSKAVSYLLWSYLPNA